ncbi:YnbE family lipoprotein [Photobacterium swingsii]|uniref:YnbE family lipoprotein n=1 Tax=Photobacterium swingsii TaxID=680026 RepID=A0A0J8VE40_9GAMM|nr:YnbE family lipoprotein [Photobacterium swingsii]KMV31571.1 membrane protein [Photobacterium swingsii]PSW24886.1 YnbE family lipoprotein [Photobacterium swingsii]
MDIIQLKFSFSLTLLAVLFIGATLGMMGCTPTVQVAASDKPIEVNLNVKIEHEIRIKVDKEIDDLFSDDDVF